MATADGKSFFDIATGEALQARLDAEARADFAAGRVISHERMSEWLAKRAKGDKVPLPSDN